MPSYDLICTDCGLGFELFRQRLLRDEDRICPGCGSSRAEQQLGVFVTARPARDNPTPRVVGFGGRACCGPGAGPHRH